MNENKNQNNQDINKKVFELYHSSIKKKHEKMNGKNLEKIVNEEKLELLKSSRLDLISSKNN